jgi:hypothetical protein
MLAAAVDTGAGTDTGTSTSTGNNCNTIDAVFALLLVNPSILQK